MEPVLSVSECSFSYGAGEFRLERVSLHVRRGQMLGIVGPNGSGKSTLLRLMAGIVRPDSGQVLVEGRPVALLGRRELARRLAFLPQHSSPAFELTVWEVVALGRYPYQGPLGLLGEQDRHVIAEALRDTDAEALAGRKFSTLSGGERQRVLIASILAQQPRIMLLDEPGAALDIHHKSQVFDLLWLLSRRGIGVVVVTHDLNTAGEFCDVLALMQDGALVEVGPASRVLREDLLSGAYRTQVRVVEHPLTGTPLVLVLSRKAHGAHTEGADRG